ncbi:MAG: hypothetical protein NZM04_06965 [Methylacidiphilales bacterium]|nr:hypothetical protein [Candidatus Methylacidiphilales bacterium]MDW8349292.1 hypothetical protein [Verrucomicrobiae bacterium]
MIYPFTLQQVSLCVGALYVLLHTWGIIHPHAFYQRLRAFIRSVWIGRGLTLAAGVWTILLVLNIDLGEFSGMRNTFVIILSIGTLLAMFFIEDFLSVRALGMLLLLAACILLDAAFLEESRARLVVTLLSYVWIVAGMVFVASPYLFREILRIGFKHSLPSRLLNGIGLLIGLCLIVLAFTAYASSGGAGD